MSPKDRLKKEHGSLRELSVKTSINYYRLSQILNGWVQPKQEEVNLLQLTTDELKLITREKK